MHYLIANRAIAALAAITAFVGGFLLGAEAGDPASVAEQTARAHNAAVIACTEAAAQRYSRCADGDVNLAEPYLLERRIPMANLDAYYRDGVDPDQIEPR